MRHRGDMTVTQQSNVGSALVVREPQFAFAVLKGTFDRESAETDSQRLLGRRSLGRFDQEVFFLFQATNVASVDQQVRSVNPTAATHPKLVRAMLPNNGPLRGVFHMTLDPLLTVDLGGMTTQVIDPPGAVAKDRERRNKPAPRVSRHFEHERQIALLERFNEGRFAAVTLVGGHPAKADTVAERPVNLFDRDDMLGTIDDIVGDVGLGSPSRIVPAFLGKKKIAAQQRPKTTGRVRVGDMDRDDAVIDLSRAATMLSLDARRLVALLLVAGLVDNQNPIIGAVLGSNDLLHAITKLAVIPLGPREKLLQRSGSDLRLQRDRSGALAPHLRELPTHVDRQVFPWFAPTKAVIESRKKPPQFAFQARNLFGSHP